ncbi:MAG: ThuA domain-containing protein [Mariniphaga sp.]|nr:ThuA domain-containing protein [Mariniphaga sp.]
MVLFQLKKAGLLPENKSDFLIKPRGWACTRNHKYTLRLFLLLPVLMLYWLSCSSVHGQKITPEQKQLIDAAIPCEAYSTPKKVRKLLVTNLSMRDGKLWKGSSHAIIPVHNYAIGQMGKITGAYEAVFNNDIEMFRPENIKQFDAICFLNTVGVLFEDQELKTSLLDFIKSGKGFVGIHDAIATFVQYPVYDQWPAFGQMLGGTENGGHPWDGELMTIQVEDLSSPLTAMFSEGSFQIADQAFQLQEPDFRKNIRVLLSIDVENTGLSPKRRILPVRTEDLDFPVSWIRSYGQGRVFFGGLGHRDSVFWNPALLKHMLAGIQFALGDLEADTTPTPQPAINK